MRKIWIRMVTVSTLVVVVLGTAACSSRVKDESVAVAKNSAASAASASTSSTSTTAVPTTVPPTSLPLRSRTKQPSDDHHVGSAHHHRRRTANRRSSGFSPQSSAQAPRAAPLRPEVCWEECRAAGRERRMHPHRRGLLLRASTVRTRRVPLRPLGQNVAVGLREGSSGAWDRLCSPQASTLISGSFRQEFGTSLVTQRSLGLKFKRRATCGCTPSA